MAEAHLRTDETLSPEDRVNLKFYVAMYVAAIASGHSKPTPDQIKNLAGSSIDKAVLEKASGDVKEVYQQLGANALVAKGSEFGEKLIAHLDGLQREPILI